VELSGSGEIRYTLDGSLPTQNSRLYTEPLKLTKTTVIRFAGFEDGKLPSDPITASYIINENHTMPVVSIAANPGDFAHIYKNYTENIEIRGSFSLYEDGGSVTVDCGVKMYGHTALQLPKKNLKVNFRGKYGADVLAYPVYGEDGPEIYDSLCLRAGQDNPQAIMREELFTSLAADMSDHVLVQKTRYCIVYVNGEYYGIYAMKEAYNETYYAQNKGVSEESVTIVQPPVHYQSEFYKLLSFAASKDMTDPANYEYLCQHIDMDSLIDWMIIQGYSANGDVEQNLRYFRSTENGNRWQYAFYDLDWAFYEHVPFSNMFSESVWQYKMLTRNIIKNPTFRQRFLERCSEVLETTLSTENVLKRIDELEAILDPEVKRDRARWGYNYKGWKGFVQSLRNFITEQNYMAQIKGRLQNYLSMTNAEVEQYFGRCK
jgi:spore coat protein CotH